MLPLATAPRESVIQWAVNPYCAPVWERLANDFKQAVGQRNEAALTIAAVTDYCAQLLPRFAVLCSEGQPLLAEATAPETVA